MGLTAEMEGAGSLGGRWAETWALSGRCEPPQKFQPQVSKALNSATGLQEREKALDLESMVPATSAPRQMIFSKSLSSKSQFSLL